MTADPIDDPAAPWRHDRRLRQRLQARLGAFPRLPPCQSAASLKAAAVVLAVVDVGDEAGLLLTRRASHLRAHAGQWALPGGRCDPGETAPQAALRELHEELALQVAPTQALGCLDDYPTRSGYRITPVVVWIDDVTGLVPNPTEVASVHRIGLHQLLCEDAVDFVAIAESERRVIRFRIDDRLIHAPTAAVLYQFRELLAGRETRVADLEQPPFAWR